MSSIAKKRVNLEFTLSGQVEDDIALEDENQTLGEFIESALLRLEVNYIMMPRGGSIDTIIFDSHTAH